MKFGLFFEFEVERGADDKVTQLYDDIIAQIRYAEERHFCAVIVCPGIGLPDAP